MGTALTIDRGIDNQPRVDVAKALEYKLKKNMSYSEIGKLMGVTKQAVQQRLERFMDLIGEPDVLQAHNDNVDNILTGAMHKIISAAVDDQKIKKSSTYQLAASYGILFDKQRLVRGQSTANVAYAEMVKQESEIDAEIKKLEQALGKPQDVVSEAEFSECDREPTL